MIKIQPLATTLLTLCLLTGCANREYKDLDKPASSGVNEVLHRLQNITNTPPESPSDRAKYYREREIFTTQMNSVADNEKERGNYDLAKSIYQQVLSVSPKNPKAQAGIQASEKGRHHKLIIQSSKELLKKDDLQAAQDTLSPILLDNPRHKDALAIQRIISEKIRKNKINPILSSIYQKPITLEFRDTDLKTIFELISKTSGINFIFDKDVRPDIKATIFIRDNSIEDAVKILLITNQLDQRVLNQNSILIYPKVPAKIRDYQDLIIKSFYLANSDVKQTANMIKTLVKTKDIFIDEKLNMLTMRDTAEAISVVEKLIAAQDLSEPEVVLEMEVLEISSSRLEELGIRYPDKIGFGAIAKTGTASGSLTLSQFKNLNSDSIRVSLADPALLLNMGKTDTDSKLLANPRIRVKNREKAKIHIGERVPVITTTSTANVGISESVSYLEVGLKLNLEPNIYLENEVAIKVSLEVSNIIDTVTTSTGSKTYRLGTRAADTTLQLRDGETQILAGLIQDFDRQSVQKIPFLGDIPILGRLFSTHGKDKTKTEIVLLITPHIVRNISRPGVDIVEFASGTESTIGSSSLSIRQGNEAPVQQASSFSKTAPSSGAISIQTAMPSDHIPSPELKAKDVGLQP